MAPNIHQLLNTSWTIHRLSPLHHEKEFPTLLGNTAALQTYASRLRDQLTGAVFAGLGLQPGGPVGGEDESLSKTGSLKNCNWEMLSAWSQLTDDGGGSTSPAGILVTLEYENIVYKAALLADPGIRSAQEEEEESTYLPLLLTRLPNPLRQTFISFLSSNFDTYCSTLRLPQGFLCSTLERYFNIFTSNAQTEGLDMLGDALKDLHLTLSFSNSVAPDLRTLSISIPRGSLTTFLSATPASEGGQHPFLANISSYLDKHLAMNLDLSSRSGTAQPTPTQKHVRLSKIACAAFVVGGEGRLKLVLPKSAGSHLYGDEAEMRSEKERLVLRASVALLHAIIRRAAAGQHQGP